MSSFECISTPVARKTYRCPLCNSTINKGLKHTKNVGYDPDISFYTARFHSDCYDFWTNFVPSEEMEELGSINDVLIYGHLRTSEKSNLLRILKEMFPGVYKRIFH